MLAFAAFTPHPLTAIPDVGKEHRGKVQRTLRSFQTLSHELYSAQPDVIISISPHPRVAIEAFTINQRPEVIVEFSMFGNLSDRVVLKNDLELGYRIKEPVETQLPVVLTDDEHLDYGHAIPLYHLTKNFKPHMIRVIPIGASALDPKQHFSFGTLINRQIHRVTKRIAVIASGDLSHGASKRLVAGYTARAARFNHMVRVAVERMDTPALLAITAKKLATVSECGIRPLLMLLGILDERKYQSSILSYEAALGVGYLTVQFQVR